MHIWNIFHTANLCLAQIRRFGKGMVIRMRKYVALLGMLGFFMAMPQAAEASENTAESETKTIVMENGVSQDTGTDYELVLLLSLSVVTAAGLAISTKNKK